MRLLTGQLVDSQQISSPTNQTTQNDQMEMLSKVIQGSSNLQNLAGLQNMQNLMNNQSYSNLSSGQNFQSNPVTNSLMASLLNQSAQNQNYLFGMNQNFQNQLSSSQLNNQSAQLLNNLMGASMQGQNPALQWGMNQMNGIGNFGSFDNQSLNEIIASQMMNFNANGDNSKPKQSK